MDAFVVFHNGKRFSSQVYSRISSAKCSITNELKYSNYKREDFEIVRLIAEKEIKHYLVSIKNIDGTFKYGIFFDYLEAKNCCDELFDKMKESEGNFTIYIDTWDKTKLLEDEVVYEKSA